MPRRISWLWFGLLGALHASGAVDYPRDVKPLLTRHCVACHGAEQTKGGLRLDTAAAARLGGDSGPALRPGHASESLLIQVLDGSRHGIPQMPYKRPPLSPADQSTLRAWIDAGAQAPVDETPGRQIHWAFVPPARPHLPQVRNTAWPRNPIDLFILDTLESQQIRPSPPADPVTLLRRVHLDLTGLPPTPEQVDAFLADPSTEAYAAVVEQLLASPHYGERWARWWLDVARYADSNGYSIDAPRSIWPWRDWVIRAFNRDLPYDTFAIEQLAGDLLPGATLDQRVATGFHRNTQINQEGGIDPEQFRIESVIDRVNTTATAFLGLTLACAQCHDHKFDPLSQREYFQIFAFFNDQDEPSLPLPSPAQEAALAEHQEKLRALEAERAALTNAPASPPDPAQIKRLDDRIRRLRQSRPPIASTMVLAERTQPRESYLFIKGDFTRRGPDVQPGTPAVLPPFNPSPPTAPRRDPPRPNRLDLARWLVQPDHPLTARVAVNRVWQQYFGRGLVETENDFGTQGTMPTHPALLDWLATEFVAQGWSFKSLHRLIVTSATYRQSSRHRPDLNDRDANNRLLARQNRLRLDAEIIRDAALTASGRLVPIIGGPSVFPPQPDGVMNLGQSNREWKPSQGPDRFRRGMYTFYWRATPHPALAVFDAPDAFSACTRRLRSNTPLQALTLLNDAAFLELANALADRLASDVPPEHHVERAFRLCLGRSPLPAERDRLDALVDAERRAHGDAAARQTLARVLLNLDETITRE